MNRLDQPELPGGRIFDIVRRNSEASVGELITLIREKLKSFARGTPQKDDLTAIVIKREQEEKLLTAQRRAFARSCACRRRRQGLPAWPRFPQ